jgi:hypothetical protein
MTSNTASVWLRFTVQRILLRCRACPSLERSSWLGSFQTQSALAVVGLAGLMGLTSWVVAWVSIWLVPIYLTTMVLIFAAPVTLLVPVQRSAGSKGVGGNSDTESSKDRGQGPLGSLSSDPPVTVEIDLMAGGAHEALASGASSSGPAAAKPRRPRSRARKPAKPVVETVPVSAPAAWIRIGPGKFVRADLQGQVDTEPSDSGPLVAPSQNQTDRSVSPIALPDVTALTTESALVDHTSALAEPVEPDMRRDIWVPSEESGTDLNPVLDSTAAALEIQANAARDELCSSALPLPGDTAQVSAPDPLISVSVAREWGIKPARFGLDRLLAASERASDCIPMSLPMLCDARAESGAGTGTEVDLIPAGVLVSQRFENHGPTPMVPCLDSALAHLGGDGESLRRDTPGTKYGWLCSTPRSQPHRRSGYLDRSRRLRSARSARSSRQFGGSARLGLAFSLRAQSGAQRRFGWLGRVQRGFRSRSPPPRTRTTRPAQIRKARSG